MQYEFEPTYTTLVIWLMCIDVCYEFFLIMSPVIMIWASGPKVQITV